MTDSFRIRLKELVHTKLSCQADLSHTWAQPTQKDFGNQSNYSVIYHSRILDHVYCLHVSYSSKAFEP